MLIGMSKHELDANEQRLDHRAPGSVTVARVHVTRGRATPPGTWVEDADTGIASVEVIPPADDRTPADKMGYRVRHAGGTLPGSNMIPSYDVRAIKPAHGNPYLVFYWKDGATSTHSPIHLILSVAAVDLGGNVGAPTYFMVCDPPVTEPQLDEIPYDPRALRIVNEGPNGWLLTDGHMRMKMFDNEEDARNGLAVAKRYTRQGFVGRDNKRPDRDDYIFEYWTGSSGLPSTPLTRVDAIPYNPTNVFATDLGAPGFRLQDGGHSLVVANDVDDALAELRFVKQHHQICFIGRDNHRPHRKQYIMTYWE